MKLHNLGLSMATALLLAACGGGSGDNNNTPIDPQNPRNNTQQPGKNVSGTYQGNVFVVPVGKMPASLADARATGSNDLTTLNANGKQIALQIPNYYVSNMLSLRNANVNGKSYKLFIVSGSGFPNSKFGYINHENNDYVFSQGAYTTNMPTSGIVRYSGSAAIGRSAVGGTANSAFVANFGQKTLTGSITPHSRSSEPFNPITINATINGNAFSTANDATVKSTGHFYGDNAHEVGGVFHDSSQALVGSFGAIRNN